MSSLNINMTQIDESLLGVDKKYTIDAYIIRDNLSNINTNERIIHYLQKLGYFNINKSNEIDNFLVKQTTKIIQCSLLDNIESIYRYKTVDQIMKEFKKTNEFNRFMIHLNERFLRYQTLNTFLENPDMNQFYNSLSLDELIYLGY